MNWDLKCAQSDDVTGSYTSIDVFRRSCFKLTGKFDILEEKAVGIQSPEALAQQMQISSATDVLP